MNWRVATCEKCVFRVGDECRRFPGDHMGYPSARVFNQYTINVIETINAVKEPEPFRRACAEYAESLDKPQEPADYIV